MKEDDFQQWYSKWAGQLGLSANPDDPAHHYDYRAAYQAGATPQPDKSGEWHWPSEFKAKDHPNRYVNGMDTLLDMMRH
jgi:hypothetical protein